MELIWLIPVAGLAAVFYAGRLTWDVLRRAGVGAAHIRLVWVPGAFELPVVAAQLAIRVPRPHAIIALGALIRGETPQFTVIAHAVAYGLQAVAVRARIPVTCGVIIATTVAQAKARAGGRLGDRGAEAARAALGVLATCARSSSEPIPTTLFRGEIVEVHA